MRNYFKFGPIVLENILDESCFSIFFLSLVSILFRGAEPIVQF